MRFVNFDTNLDPATHLDSSAVAMSEIVVAAILDVTNLATNETRQLRPVYIIEKNRSVNVIPDGSDDWGLEIFFTGMDANSGEIRLNVEGAEVEQADWVLVQAFEKPVISLVWIGIILLTFGFGLAIVRRVGEVKMSMKRGGL